MLNLWCNAQMNVLEKTLSFQFDHRNEGYERDKMNPKHKNYNFTNSIRLAQFFSKICVLCTVKGHGITKMYIDW